MKLTKLLSLVLLTHLCCATAANAAIITLSPTSPILDVNDGDMINLDVLMDFTAEPTLGGGFDIAFDNAALQFLGFTNNDIGDPAFSRDPDILAGLLSGWAFGDFNGVSGPATVGTVSFQVLSTMGMSTSITPSDTASAAGPFISAVTFVDILPVDYNGVTITKASSTPQPAPEPATVMLLGIGLLLASMKRKRVKPGVG